MRRSMKPAGAEKARSTWGRRVVGALVGAALSATMVSAAHAEAGAYIVFDLASGQIYGRHNADQAWYPASITKLMTTYVVFQMIKQGKLTFNSPVIVSTQAAKQPPSKMGFPPGTVLTIDNALKMIMVKSANDIAWAISESVGGSRENFAAMMNAYAREIGMTESVWSNPNGLPDTTQHTTAHDMALLARALLREFPEYDFYYRLPGIQLGNRVIPNHNHLMDHYPGADGMKTGYICSAGFNVVASATRNGHRMVAVVLGAHGARPRAELAAELFNRAFERASGAGTLLNFADASETLDAYRPGPEMGQPVRDIKAEICGGKRNTGSDEAIDEAPVTNAPGTRTAQVEYLSPRFDIGKPVKVWIGGADAVAARSAALSLPVTYAAPQPVSTPVVQKPAMQRAPGAILKTQAPVQPNPGEAEINDTFKMLQSGDGEAPAAKTASAPAPAAAQPALRGMPVPEARPQGAETRKPVRPAKKATDAKKPTHPAKQSKPQKPMKPESDG
jgi:D-alanyl-D-alanine carboxypeptidase